MDNQAHLKYIMTRDGLSYDDVANLVAGGDIELVRSWLQPPHADSFQIIPKNTLWLLHYVCGIRICKSLKGIEMMTGALSKDIKRQMYQHFISVNGRIMSDKPFARRLYNEKAVAKIEDCILADLADEWLFIPIEGPKGQCYAATRGRIVPVQNRYQLHCEDFDTLRALQDRIEEHEDAAKQTRIEELRREQTMYEELYAAAIDECDYAKAARIDDALNALSLSWAALN
jgi:hypothetical protein